MGDDFHRCLVTFDTLGKGRVVVNESSTQWNAFADGDRYPPPGGQDLEHAASFATWNTLSIRFTLPVRLSPSRVMRGSDLVIDDRAPNS